MDQACSDRGRFSFGALLLLYAQNALEANITVLWQSQ